MPDQLVFDLPIETAFDREDYFVSDANALVVEQVRDWKNWVNGRLVLCGPTGSGKSHLASIWASDVEAEIVMPNEVSDWRPKAFARPVMIDPVDADISEQSLLFLLNAMKEKALPVLCVMDTPPARSAIVLPDLKSRLEASSLAELKAVDDGLIGAVLLKLMDERQLIVDPDVVAFALKHAERDLTAVKKLVEMLDRLSLQHKKAVTKRLVSDAIAKLKQGEEHE
ncbi:MAG: hypothetical protein AAFR98_00440 [Pseudomonadota bacterium]